MRPKTRRVRQKVTKPKRTVKRGSTDHKKYLRKRIGKGVKARKHEVHRRRVCRRKAPTFQHTSRSSTRRSRR